MSSAVCMPSWVYLEKAGKGSKLSPLVAHEALDKQLVKADTAWVSLHMQRSLTMNRGLN